MCPVRLQHGTCLSIEACCARAVGCCLFSSRDAGSVRITYSAEQDDVVGFQVVGTTLRQVTASAEGVGVLTIDHPACVYATCKGTANISSPAIYAERSGHV